MSLTKQTRHRDPDAFPTLQLFLLGMLTSRCLRFLPLLLLA